MQTKPMEVWAPRCANDFEAVVFAQHPELEVRRAQMGETAPLARMSGSGSSLFALRELPAGPHDFETLSRARFVEAWRDSGLSLPEPS
jgi:4-diphosphocytidyl-2C-methyl-D-erythritol kinase